jgi:hypothetical protein
MRALRAHPAHLHILRLRPSPRVGPLLAVPWGTEHAFLGGRAGGSTLIALSSFALADDDTCDPGSTDVLAYMPVDQVTWPPTGPTYPEGVAVTGNRVIVSGPANFGTAGNGSPSQLTSFDRTTGALVEEVPVIGEYTDYEHALSEITVKGRYAYAPSTQLGVLRWDFRGRGTPTQTSVSTPFCSVTGSFPCHTESDACPGGRSSGVWARVRRSSPRVPRCESGRAWRCRAARRVGSRSSPAWRGWRRRTGWSPPA